MGNKKGLIRIMAAVFLLSFLLLISGREVLAEEVIFDDMKYSLNETDKTAELKLGKNEKDLAIPVKINYKGVTYQVTSIGTSAFNNVDTISFDNLSSVTIPEGVKEIGDHAFISCPLSSVTIPASVETLKTGVFKYCTNLSQVTFVGNRNLRTIGIECF